MAQRGLRNSGKDIGNVKFKEMRGFKLRRAKLTGWLGLDQKVPSKEIACKVSHIGYLPEVIGTGFRGKKRSIDTPEISEVMKDWEKK